MTKNIKLSKQIREYFVKDQGLPIQVVEDPYFEYYLKLFDPYFQSMDKLSLLRETIEILGNENGISDNIKDFRNKVTTCVEEHSSYKNFTNDIKLPDPVTKLNKGNLYVEGNNDILFTSIDLVEANFQSLKMMCHDIFPQNSYVEFAKQFTNLLYVINSKKVRQIIFGQLCPSRQQHVQRYIMSKIKQHLLDSWSIKEPDFISTSSDEIVFKSNCFQEMTGNIVGKKKNHIYECKIPGIEGIRLRVTVFRLIQMGSEKYKFFVKYYEDGRKEIKQVDGSYLPEVIKFFEGRRVIPKYDRLFIRDGRLCQFKDSLF